MELLACRNFVYFVYLLIFLTLAGYEFFALSRFLFTERLHYTRTVLAFILKVPFNTEKRSYGRKTPCRMSCENVHNFVSFVTHQWPITQANPST